MRWTVFAVLALLAFAVRLPQLGERPMHTDESVNAYITGELLNGEAFHYDPQDRHGPVLYLLATPIARLSGAKHFSDLTETELRITPALAGSFTVLLFGAAVELFGFLPSIFAAILFGFAPLTVYYNRYFIHETFFVAATFGLILSGHRMMKTGSAAAAVLAGLSAALMLACKETAIIHFAALAAAARFGWIQRESRKISIVKLLAVSSAVFITTTILLFTWFGRNWTGLPDLLRALQHSFVRAHGEGHEKPFWYYGAILAGGWSGPLLLLLAVIAVAFLVLDFCRNKTPSPILFISIYGILTIGIYSAIPYKTPWLALNLWLPLSLAIGGLISRIRNQSTHRAIIQWIFAPAVLILVTTTSHDLIKRVFLEPASEQNPYAYAHTGEDLLRLEPRLEQLANARHASQPTIAVVAADPWPLPWYLRKFSRVGYWQPGQVPGAADFYITATDATDKLPEKLSVWRPEFFGVRPNVLILLWTPPGSPP